MSITVSELARLIGGQVTGDGQVVLDGAARLDLAGPREVSLADSALRQREVAASAAGAVVATADVPCGSKPVIVVDDVHSAFSQVVRHFRPDRAARRIGVSPAATVAPTAQLGVGVEIHPHASIGEEVQLGDQVTIHAGVVIMPGCTIGAGTTIYPNCVLYEDCRIGNRCIVHAGAVLGAFGFGYEQVEGQHVLSAQLGYVEVEDDVEIGAGTTIDRGTYGPTIIGAGTKIDNLVMIAHNCRIGPRNLICSQAGVAGSTTTGEYVVMAGQVGVRDHVHIGDRAVLGSKAGVSNDVADDAVMLGQPATAIRQQKLQMAAVAKLPEMRRQFRILQREFAQLKQEGPDRPNDQAA